MIQDILKIIESKPKHFSKIIKNDVEMLDWVLKNSLVDSNNLSEMIYSAVHQQSNICKLGQRKKFTGINTGYTGCGPASKCSCVAETVSEKVKKTKAKVTAEQQAETNDKRRRTNLDKYGVSCVAQTPENKQKFQNWYADPTNVEKNLTRIKQTNLKRYGVENCKSLPEIEQKIIATCLARYQVSNVAQIPSTKAKPKARTAEYKLSGHLLKKGFDRFKKYINDRYNFTLLTSPAEYDGIKQRDVQEMEFSCNACGYQIKKKFYHSRGLNCDICNPRVPNYTSTEEQEIYDYISKELGYDRIWDCGHQKYIMTINDSAVV